MKFVLPGYAAQGLAVCSANLIMVAGGMLFGWSSPSLSKYVSDDAELPLTSAEFSWVVTFFTIGCIFGPLLTAYLVDLIGRKWTLVLVVIPEIICWLMIAFATSYEMLCAARCIGGLGHGAAYAIIPMYSGEVAEDHIRGALGSLMNGLLNLGFVISYSTGPWVSTRILAFVSMIPLLVFLVIFIWMPESPYYLIMKDKRLAARTSLAWFRGSNDVDKELGEIEYNVKQEQMNKTSILELVRNKGNRKAVIIMLGLIFAQQSSGVHAIQAYASSMFAETGLDLSPDVAVIIIGVVKLSTGIFMVFVVDFTGRRPILNFSTIGTAIFLLIVAIFYNLQAVGKDVSSVSWIPLFGVIGFYLTYTGGLSNLPQAILGELFPTNVKANATMVMAMYAMAAGALMTKLYQVVADPFGIHAAFYGFMVFTLLGAVFIWILLPETKGISLQEIQNRLNGRTEPTANIAEHGSNKTYQQT